MEQEFKAKNYLDENFNPAGGSAKVLIEKDAYHESTCVQIQWQDGPLGRGDDKQEPNGAFVETVIAIARNRLAFYQMSKFKCEDNERAIKALNDALVFLSERTHRRKEAGTEGTHKGI